MWMSETQGGGVLTTFFDGGDGKIFGGCDLIDIWGS